MNTVLKASLGMLLGFFAGISSAKAEGFAVSYANMADVNFAVDSSVPQSNLWGLQAIRGEGQGAVVDYSLGTKFDDELNFGKKADTFKYEPAYVKPFEIEPVQIEIDQSYSPSIVKDVYFKGYGKFTAEGAYELISSMRGEGQGHVVAPLLVTQIDQPADDLGGLKSLAQTEFFSSNQL